MKNGWPWASVIDNIINHPIVWVGLSGGMDSMVLLDTLSHLEPLKGRLKAIHVNHGLSPNAAQWQAFCQKQCDLRQIPLVCESVHIPSQANLEAVARDKRYDAFLKFLAPGDALVLAHHLDDQIETFFLNFLRGCGVSGLSAMPLKREWHHISIYRPLLDFSREAVRTYALAHDLSWIEDESNQDIKYSRNFLRHQVLPLIESHWPNYRKSVSHTIESCQTTDSDLKQRALKDYPKLTTNPKSLSISLLQTLSHEQILIIIRLWLEQQHVPMPSQKRLTELLSQFIFRRRQDTQPLLSWDNWQFRCYQDDLYVLPILSKTPLTSVWADFPKPFSLPDGGFLVARPSQQGIYIEKNAQVKVSYRSGGEKILYQGHHRTLKNLMQQWKIPSFQRQHMPLLYINDVLKVVVGFAYADTLGDSKGTRFEIDWLKGVNDVDCGYSHPSGTD